MKKMIFIGGDMRFVYAANALRERYDTALSGFGNVGEGFGLRSPDEGEKFDIAVLPIFARGEDIPFPLGSGEALPLSELPHFVGSGSVVFAGKCPDPLKKVCADNRLALYDYVAREEFAVMNAVLTAEGAVSIAVKETDHSLLGANVLILGFGRIGKVTARYFSALGACVSCAARKPADIAWIKADGYSPVSFHDTDAFVSALSNADIIINTVPAKLITGSLADTAKKSAVLIELASVSCTDDEAREKLRVICAGGLPGKFSPVTAGKIIADTIDNILTERSMNNGGA